jgi:hypothetical protein
MGVVAIGCQAHGDTCQQLQEGFYLKADPC